MQPERKALIASCFGHSGAFSLARFLHILTQTCFALSSAEHRITKKFELESEEEKRKMNESFSAIFENFTREKEVTGCSQVESVVRVVQAVEPSGPAYSGDVLSPVDMLLLVQLFWKCTQKG